jgi:hypothetical protein
MHEVWVNSAFGVMKFASKRDVDPLPAAEPV